MKYILSAAMLAPVAMVQPAFAQDADEAPASKEQQVLEAMVAVTAGAIEIIAEIKDTATADAAAQGLEQLATLAAQVSEAAKGVDPEAMGKLIQENAEDIEKLDTTYQSMLKVLAEKEYFGSAALKTAVEKLETAQK
ncbi:hypothetical protein ICN84_04460 [Akkermansia glycaniphila]|uniref:hypothetical protein n=1 Tax=Akkermansia glycaniphila TaxID=1679444 RepID=UPI001C0381D7|nr:hypothetical protein [Akkermansia glycaniphila]MBT9449326.1 hypothetical protein [Akkermansia glycaniphila]